MVLNCVLIICLDVVLLSDVKDLLFCESRALQTYYSPAFGRIWIVEGINSCNYQIDNAENSKEQYGCAHGAEAATPHVSTHIEI